jgi:hypothetical protein
MCLDVTLSINKFILSPSLNHFETIKVEKGNFLKKLRIKNIAHKIFLRSS